MSNLLNHPYGTAALREAVADQIRARIRRWFERNTNIAFYDWVTALKIPNFDLATVLDDLNVVHDQEILDLYQLLKALYWEDFAVDADFYIDTVTGDDNLGNGTVLNPWATIGRAQQILPEYINSNINIFVSAPVANPVFYMYDMNHTFGPDGQLSIQGIDDPVIVDGPYTVNTWTDVGVGMTYAHDINVLAAGWVPNAYTGNFVHVLTGANAGRIFAIKENQLNDLAIPYTLFPMASGDTFEIVTPGTNIVLAFQYFRAAFNAPQNEQNARFILANLNFWALAPEFSGQPSCDMWFAFVNMVDCSYTGNSINCNLYAPYNAAEIVNAFLRNYGQPFFYAEILENYCKFMMQHLAAIDDIYNMSGYLSLVYCAFVNYYSQNMSDGHIEQSFVAHTTGNAIDLIDNERLTINGLWIERAVNGINIHKGDCQAYFLEGTPANITSYGVIVGGFSSLVFDGTPVGGVMNDVGWTITSAVAAYPAIAGTGITDGVGSWVIKRG